MKILSLRRILQCSLVDRNLFTNAIGTSHLTFQKLNNGRIENAIINLKSNICTLKFIDNRLLRILDKMYFLSDNTNILALKTDIFAFKIIFI